MRRVQTVKTVVTNCEDTSQTVKTVVTKCEDTSQTVNTVFTKSRLVFKFQQIRYPYKKSVKKETKCLFIAAYISK